MRPFPCLPGLALTVLQAAARRRPLSSLGLSVHARGHGILAPSSEQSPAALGCHVKDFLSRFQVPPGLGTDAR